MGWVDQQIIPGGKSLNQGIPQVQTAIDKENGLKDSVSSYTAAVAKIEEGTTTLDSKSNDLVDGVTKLSDGSSELADALSSGADAISDVISSEDKLDMFSAPVTIEVTQITKM